MSKREKSRLPEMFADSAGSAAAGGSNSDSDGGTKRRRRSSRRKGHEAAAKIKATARREAAGSDDDGEDGGGGGGAPKGRSASPTDAEQPKLKKRMRDVPALVPVEDPSHDLIKLQQLLDQLEAREGNFLGVRWALPILAQMTSLSGAAKHDFKIHACPDLLRPLIELMADWLRRPAIPLTHTDDTQQAEMARRCVAATQIVRNLSIKPANTELLANYAYLIPSLAALANDLPLPDGAFDRYLHTRATRDDSALTFGSAAGVGNTGKGTAHPIEENIMATLANLAPALALHDEGGVHTCLPVIVCGLWADHKVIASHAATALSYLSMPPANLPLLMTALPDILEKFAKLLDSKQMRHIDIRCSVIQTLRNLSFQGHDVRSRIVAEPRLLSQVFSSLEHSAEQSAPRGTDWNRDLTDASLELLANLAEEVECLPSLYPFEDRLLVLACSHERLVDPAERVVDLLRP